MFVVRFENKTSMGLLLGLGDEFTRAGSDGATGAGSSC